MTRYLLIFAVLYTLSVECADQNSECPNLYKHVFVDNVPRANLSAGVYSIYGNRDGVTHVTLRECVLACCILLQCNVALLTKMTGKCYHVTCASNEMCLPQDSGSSGGTRMVLVRPIDVDGLSVSWADLLLPEHEEKYHDVLDSLWRMADENSFEQQTEIDEMLLDRISSTRRNNDNVSTNLLLTTMSPHSKLQSLDVTVLSKQVQLPENNVTLVANVQQLDPNTQTHQYQYEWITLQQPDGQSGAIRMQLDNRLELSHLSQGLYMFNVTVSSKADESIGWALANVTVLAAVRVNRAPEIIITPTNQTIRLPNTVAVLDASATSDDMDSRDNIQYHWELQQGPLGYQPTLLTTATLQLGDLTRPGQYTFQVTAVDTEGAQSQALAYVTVLSPIDYPPTADAGPDQVLYLPLSDGELVLTGNLSTDDHDIVSWEWTRVNTLININNVSDISDNNMQAIDMRDTRTQTLRLGRIIEPGVYTFQLRVEDASNQTSTAQIRLFVKEREDTGEVRRPLAIVRDENITLDSGNTWITLDGSNSTALVDNIPSDDSPITSNANKITDAVLHYRWDLLSSPNTTTVQIISPLSSTTNVTGLNFPGIYHFRLQVNINTFNNGTLNTSSALVNVTVPAAVIVQPNQNKIPPTAVATLAVDSENGNYIQLPRNVIYLNASQSQSVNSVIVSYRWNPCIDSPPLTVLPFAEGTDQHPVLVLIVKGSSMTNAEEAVEMCWNVTIRDSNGLLASQEVTFNLLPDEMLEYLVEMIVGISNDLTMVAYNALIHTFESLSASVRIHVHNAWANTANTAMFTIYATIYATDNDNITTFFRAEDLISLLMQHEQEKLHLISVRPASCRSLRCSNHGICDPVTRTCHCHALWLPNFLSSSLLWGNTSAYGNINCSWSVLYVTLATLSVIVCIGCLCWRLWLCYRGQNEQTQAMKCVQKPLNYRTRRSRVVGSKGSQQHSYMLLDNSLLQQTGEGKLKQRHKLQLSDSDDSVDRVFSGDSDDNIVFNSLNNKLPPNTMRGGNKLKFNA